uniref:Enoyl-[acyl-carrier-protein] reductase, mitochondrial n=1 Tax=Panagrellus redivivus TaxID=6233 RepID=A0A7E5A035_PANRE
MLRRVTHTVFARRQASQLIYEKHGDPQEVIGLKELPDLKNEALGAADVRIRFRASPINPADINQIQGVYPVKPALPAVGGNEGLAVVEAVGSGVKSLAVGDYVIPTNAGFGTWRSEAITTATRLFKVDKRLPLDFGATLHVNPCTAYRMLFDFVDLKKGDTVVQNGANSAVGRYVIQIARQLGLETINVVRNRPAIADLKADLTSLGATQVLTEEEFAKSVRGIKSQLALNCVGGRSSRMISHTLVEEGVMVTYGGMSKEPVQGATGPFIFKDITFRGFWMTKWYKQSLIHAELTAKREKMYADIADWIIDGSFAKPKIVYWKPEQYKEALKEATSSADAKQLFKFE